jgi:hypothetical protein
MRVWARELVCLVCVPMSARSLSARLCVRERECAFACVRVRVCLRAGSKTCVRVGVC